MLGSDRAEGAAELAERWPWFGATMSLFCALMAVAAVAFGAIQLVDSSESAAFGGFLLFLGILLACIAVCYLPKAELDDAAGGPPPHATVTESRLRRAAAATVGVAVLVVAVLQILVRVVELGRTAELLIGLGAFGLTLVWAAWSYALARTSCLVLRAHGLEYTARDGTRERIAWEHVGAVVPCDVGFEVLPSAGGIIERRREYGDWYPVGDDGARITIAAGFLPARRNSVGEVLRRHATGNAPAAGARARPARLRPGRPVIRMPITATRRDGRGPSAPKR